MLHLGKLNAPGSAMDDDGYLMQTSAPPPMKPTLVTRPTPVGKSNFAVVEVVSGKWVSTGIPNRKQKGPKNKKWLTKVAHQSNYPRQKQRGHHLARATAVFPVIEANPRKQTALQK